MAATARFDVDMVDLGGHSMAQAVHTRRVALGSVHKSLQGVTFDAPVPVLLGESGGRAAVMGDMPGLVSTEQEIRTCAASLLRHGQIEFAAPSAAVAGAASAVGGVAKKARQVPRETHRVVKAGNGRMLVRVRFSCGCHRR